MISQINRRLRAAEFKKFCVAVWLAPHRPTRAQRRLHRVVDAHERMRTGWRPKPFASFGTADEIGNLVQEYISPISGAVD